MSEKLLLKKVLFDELKTINKQIKETDANDICELVHLSQRKEFVQKIIDICVDRNKF